MTGRIAIPESIKKKVVLRQRSKCANKPNSNLKDMSNYKCLLWICYDFDHSHINDNSIYKILA